MHILKIGDERHTAHGSAKTQVASAHVRRACTVRKREKPKGARAVRTRGLAASVGTLKLSPREFSIVSCYPAGVRP